MSIARRGDGRTQKCGGGLCKETVGRIVWKQEVLEEASRIKKADSSSAGDSH